jgi:hypothetical protein
MILDFTVAILVTCLFHKIVAIEALEHECQEVKISTGSHLETSL